MTRTRVRELRVHIHTNCAEAYIRKNTILTSLRASYLSLALRLRTNISIRVISRSC
jgi:hypothetical protein